MRFRKLGLAIVTASLAASPVLAQSATPAVSAAQSQSVRVGVSSDEQKLEGGSGILLAILAAAAVIAGIVIAADSGGSNTPTSP